MSSEPVVEMIPVPVVEMIPVPVVEMIPVPVVEMIPVAANAVEVIANVKSDAQRMV
jgi:hypothetical protein